jgi:sulfoxide reductase catalytic subunit YedY
MKNWTPNDIRPSEITPRENYLNRRELLAAAGVAVPAMLAPGLAMPAASQESYKRLAGVRPSALSTRDAPNPWEHVTTYNNYYEFGVDKEDPAENSGKFRPKPWSVAVDGECEVKGSFTYEDIVKPHPLEERIYRFRCVEAWSLIVPWVGFPLGDLVKRFKPTSKAKYVAFETVLRPTEMPGQKDAVLPWPYVEGLTMAEAMHPLAILAVGLYGVELPNQNGAPLRLIVPWKYGFKGIKSIVKIRFTERQPRTTWAEAGPREYGFYANVNPAVDHPRWSQKTERRIGSGFFTAKQPTLPFNGYADQVAQLYAGLDLVRNF